MTPRKETQRGNRVCVCAGGADRTHTHRVFSKCLEMAVSYNLYGGLAKGLRSSGSSFGGGQGPRRSAEPLRPRFRTVKPPKPSPLWTRFFQNLLCFSKLGK